MLKPPDSHPPSGPDKPTSAPPGCPVPAATKGTLRQRWIDRLLAAGITIILTTAIAAIGKDQHRSAADDRGIRTERLAIVDAEGTARLELRLDDDGQPVAILGRGRYDQRWALRFHDEEPVISVLRPDDDETGSTVDLAALATWPGRLARLESRMEEVRASLHRLREQQQSFEGQLRDTPTAPPLLRDDVQQFQRALSSLRQSITHLQQDVRSIENVVHRQQSDLHWIEREVRDLRNRVR